MCPYIRQQILSQAPVERLLTAVRILLTSRKKRPALHQLLSACVAAWLLFWVAAAGSRSYGLPFWWHDWAERTVVSLKPHPAIVRVVASEKGALSCGSGTLIARTEDYGLVLTNWHVIRDAKGGIEVDFPTGMRMPAVVVAADGVWDLALLMIPPVNVNPIPLADQVALPGEQLVIAGYGRGNYRAAAGRCVQYVAPGIGYPAEMLEVGVGARQGDSGGPILNAKGQLAGVLFGTTGGRTIGSHAGRVRQFLQSSQPRLSRAYTSLIALCRAKGWEGRFGTPVDTQALAAGAPSGIAPAAFVQEFSEPTDTSKSAPAQATSSLSQAPYDPVAAIGAGKNPAPRDSLGFSHGGRSELSGVPWRAAEATQLPPLQVASNPRAGSQNFGFSTGAGTSGAGASAESAGLSAGGGTAYPASRVGSPWGSDETRATGQKSSSWGGSGLANSFGQSGSADRGEREGGRLPGTTGYGNSPPATRQGTFGGASTTGVSSQAGRFSGSPASSSWTDLTSGEMTPGNQPSGTWDSYPSSRVGTTPSSGTSGASARQATERPAYGGGPGGDFPSDIHDYDYQYDYKIAAGTTPGGSSSPSSGAVPSGGDPYQAENRSSSRPEGGSSAGFGYRWGSSRGEDGTRQDAGRSGGSSRSSGSQSSKSSGTHSLEPHAEDAAQSSDFGSESWWMGGPSSGNESGFSPRGGRSAANSMEGRSSWSGSDTAGAGGSREPDEEEISEAVGDQGVSTTESKGESSATSGGTSTSAAAGGSGGSAKSTLILPEEPPPDAFTLLGDLFYETVAILSISGLTLALLRVLLPRRRRRSTVYYRSRRYAPVYGPYWEP